MKCLAIQEINYIILKEIWDRKDPRIFEIFRSCYNQEESFVSYYIGSTLRNYYGGKKISESD